MKTIFYVVLFSLLISFSSCEKVSDNAVELTVEFTWEGVATCGWGNPEIHIGGIPEKTKYIKLHMYDHEYNYDHGSVVAPYTGEDTIPKNRYKKIQCPCPPPYAPGEYKITIKAIDENETVIGIGSKTRFFPEKNQ